MPSLSSVIQIKGDVIVELVDAHGVVRQKWAMPNSTADNLKVAVAKALAGAPTGFPAYIGANSSGGELGRTPISARSNPQGKVARLFGSFANADAVGTIVSLNLWDAVTGGNLCATASCSIVKPNNEVLNVYWNISFL